LSFISCFPLWFLQFLFLYCPRGSLSLIVSNITHEAGKISGATEVEDIHQAILESARDSVDATPAIALPPLFECALSSGNHIVINNGRKQPLLCSLNTIIETLFGVLNEETSSSNFTYMLNEMSKLFFRGRLLLDEYKMSYRDDNCGPMPIMQAFQRLLQMAGASKPFICKTVVSRISVAWLGPDDGLESDVGMCAIPYRDHIVDLLVFKECRFDEGSAHSGEGAKWGCLPEATDSSSITRAFVLSFLSKLPSPGGMSNVVLKQLAHVVIMKLLDICCTSPARGKAFISGSETYARMTRGWQALCLMSRFVTDDIAPQVASGVFNAMSFTLHGQIRYFIEVFTIQCTRVHPTIFGQMFIQEVRRRDLSLPHVSTLMIIGGNLTVGRYSNDFFHSPTDPRMKDVLCGVLPWLSSTQGFSRAIAQLLCHKLIPLVVDVYANISPDGPEKNDAVLRAIYSFLENNTDMIRLRKKQQLFFDSYDVDSVCSFNGIVSIPVDEGEEANPTHMIDAIKDCLEEVYKEAHDDDAPAWKQMEDLLLGTDLTNLSKQPNDGSSNAPNETELVNFQRKILPIDSLDLGIRSFHEQKLYNAAGKKKQKLIVCATLIDKVPNLAGLARTCEIFAARTLVVPNLLVRKQDDFKSISASANDWIEMEECKEQDLMSWLYKKKAGGYSILGVEQTSSSKCLTNMVFPEKCVLLLGKEKEGIPIQFLSAVDQCIEIPQLGIIRSLNVHVSGAISIWEYTKQMMKSPIN
jgi:tRNA guanosine-2'-O-methyltransferase